MTKPVIDAVVIGRNEGPRLLACLNSLRGQVRSLVYVDSGSDDGSVAAARDLGATVVELDLSRPFTAARARNAGLEALHDGCDFVQLVDGDCTVDTHWIAIARDFLLAHTEVAAACGRRREINPQHSLYNQLCDMEWDTPIGAAKACGGDVLMRLAALRQVGGYRDDLIAGEEPELCVRLRRSGWQIWRLDAEMTLHDAQMTRFSQWWRRSRRAGHAFAEGAWLHGAPPDRHWVSETRRALIWGAALPACIAAAALAEPGALIAAAIYPLQVIRLSPRMGWLPALFSVIGKFAEAAGALEFYLRSLRGHKRGLIEYK